MAKVDLEFLARQFERVISDLATLKDDAMVVMARLDRIDATVQSLVVRSEPCTAATNVSRAGSSVSRSGCRPMAETAGVHDSTSRFPAPNSRVRSVSPKLAEISNVSP